MRHKILYIIVAFCLLSIRSFSQVSDGKVILSTEVPSSTMYVGEESKDFYVAFKNSQHENLVKEITFTITHPTGIEVASNSVKLATDREDAQITVDPIDVNNPNILKVKVAIANGVDFDQEIKITYQAKASCSIIPKRMVGEKAKAVIVGNEVQCTYINSNGTNSFTTSEGPIYKTSSYNILYADLMLMLTNDDTHKEGYRYMDNESSIPVLNAIGAGKTSKIRILVTSDEVNTQFTKATISGMSTGGPVVDIIRKKLSGSTFYYDIDSDILSKIGLGEALDGGEGFVIKESAWISGAAYTIEKKYQTQWGVSFDKFCNNDPVGMANGTATVYFENKLGAPVFSVESKMITKPSFCSGEGIIRFTFKNSAVNKNGGAFDIYPYVYCPGVSLVGVYVDADKDGICEQKVNISSGPYASFSFDKTCGFSDLDRDGKYDDLEAGGIVTMDVHYTIQPYMNDGTGFTRNVSIPGFTYCNNFKQYIGSCNTTGYYDYVNCSISTNFANKDLFRGKPNQLLYWTAYYYGYVGLISNPCGDLDVYTELKLPKGFKLNDGKVFCSGSEVPFEVANDIIRIRPKKENVFSAYNYYYVNLDLDCLPDVKSGLTILDILVNFKCGDGDCVGNILKNTAKQNIYSHFNCDNSIIKNVNVFLERRSFGWKASNHTGFWYKKDLTDDLKIDITKDDKSRFVLDQCYTFDNVEAKVKGEITPSASSPFNKLVAQFNYTSPISDNIFDLNNVIIKVEDREFTGSDIDYTYNIDTKTRICNLSFTLNNVSDISGLVDVTASLKVNGKMYQTSGGIADFRGNIVLKQEDNIVAEESAGLKANFSIRDPYIYLYSNTYNDINVLWNINSNILSWPNEYRPVFHTQKFELQLPLTHTIETVTGTGFLAGITKDAYEVDANNMFRLKPEALPLIGYDNMNSYFYPSLKITFKANCASSTVISQQPLDVEFSQCDYANLDLKSSSPTPINEIHGARADVVDKKIVTFYPTSKPTLGLELESYQPGIKNRAKWVTRIVEKNTANSPSTWISFEPSGGNLSSLKIENAYKEDGKTPFPKIKRFGANQQGIMVDIGQVNQNGFVKVILEASYTNCVDGTTDHIDVKAGWDPISVDKYSQPADYPTVCSPLIGTLDLAMKSANMQWEVNQVENKTFNLCDNVKYLVSLKSTGVANMYDAAFGLKLPPFVTLTSDVNVKYVKNSTGETTSYTLSRNDILGANPYLLEQLIPSLKTESEGFIGNSRIDLDFSVSTTCGFDAGSFVEFSALGTSNCSDKLAFKSNQRIPIAGFTNLETIKTFILPVNMTDWNVPTNVSIQVNNIGFSSTIPTNIDLILTPGLSYVARSASELGEPSIIALEDGSTKLTWAWPNGTSIVAGKSKIYSLKIITSGTSCSVFNDQLTASVYTKRFVASSCGGPDCEVVGTYDKFTRNFVRPPFTFSTPLKPVLASTSLSLMDTDGVLKICKDGTALKLNHGVDSNIPDIKTDYEWSIWLPGKSVPEVVSGSNIVGAIASISVDEDGNASIIWADGSTGRFDIKLRKKNSCKISSYSAALAINLVKKPEKPGSIDGPEAVCAGSSTNFKIGDQNLQSVYRWTIDGGATIQNTENGAVSIKFPTSSLPFTISVVSYNQVCGSSDPIQKVVTVNPLPNANFSGFNPSHTYCIDGNVVNLTPEKEGGLFMGLGVEVIDNHDVFSPQKAGRGEHVVSYTITENGCSASVDQKIIVTAPLVDFVGLKGNYCLNTPAFKLQGTPVGGIFTIATKDKPESEIVATTFNPEALKSGVFVVKYSYTDPTTGCSGVASMDVAVHDLPQVTIIADKLNTLCANEDLELTAQIAEGGRAPFTYNWTNASSKLNFVKIKTKVSAEYKVNVIDNTGCSVSASYSLNVLPTPEVKIDETIPVTCRESKDGKVTFNVAYLGTESLTYKVYGVNLTDSPILKGETHTVDNLAYGHTVIEVNSSNGCKGFAAPLVGFGGPIFRVEADPIICAGYDNQPSPIYFTVKATRQRPLPSGDFRFTITSNSGTFAGVGSFAESSFRVGPINALPGDTFTFSVVADDLSKNPTGNGCYINPIKVSVKAADLYLEPVSKVKFIQCKPGDPISFKARARLSDGTTINTSQLEFRLLYAVNGSFAPVEDATWRAAEKGGGVTYPNLTKPGNYRVQVKYNGKETCTPPLNFTIEESKLAVSVITRDARCFGDNDGAISAKAIGSFGEVGYQWSSEQLDSRQANNAEIRGLKPGFYNLKVIDSGSGCSISYPNPIEVKQPEKLQNPEIIVDDNNPCQPYAQIAGGGTPKYRFDWYSYVNKDASFISFKDFMNNSGKTNLSKELVKSNSMVYSETVDGNISRPPVGITATGYYYVKVVDANGCTVTMDPPKDVTSEVGIREYDIAFRWVSKPVDVDTTKKDKANTIIGELAESVTKTIDYQVYKCIQKYVDSYVVDLDLFCHSASAVDDKLSITYNDLPHYYYTLYYYDRAGNLISTVAPEGVHYVSSRSEIPQHEYRSLYYYNSLGQVVSQESPDAGKTQFIYNVKGQLRFSQNAKQRKDGTCSYSKYDELGRVVESGVYKGNNGTDMMSVLAEIVKNEDEKGFDEDEGGLPMAKRFPNTEDEQVLKQITERTVTIYTMPNLDLLWKGSPQRYLVNRISQVYSYTIDGSKIATFYSYDSHGNVEWIVNEIPGLGRAGIDYQYDLVSNKVTKVAINDKRKDSFYTKYSYDEDNRIQQVFSSVNGLAWCNDASYYYYEHGPLRRVELGTNKLQGIDYTYTLNGWLKAINTPDLDPSKDDKLKGFAPDIFGMVLGYYDGDFVKKGSSRFTAGDKYQLSVSSAGVSNLYNGNISTWVTSKLPAVPGVNAGDISGIGYSYDILNRIKSAKFNTFTQDAFITKPDYAENFRYDLNGNITNLQRKGNSANGLDMDDLTYSYNTDVSKVKNNQLLSITDKVVSPTNYDDIKTQKENNYGYDEIGNLISNKDDKIEIKWNTSGKISEVCPEKGSGKPHLIFWYDAMGNRIRKQVNTSPDYDGNGSITGTINSPENVTTTYYMRDITGNTLAIYERRNQKVGEGDSYKAIYTLSELPIYGSDRIGMYSPSKEEVLSTVMFKKADFDKISPDLDRVNTILSGSNNMLVASEQSVILSQGTTSSDGTTATPTVTVVNTTIGNVSSTGTAYGLSNKLSFTGNLGGPLAFGESERGELRFYVVPASSYLGMSNPSVLVFNSNNELMMNSDNLQLDPNKKITVTRVPGDDSERYLIMGADSEGNLRSSVVDMNLNGGLGDIAYKNELVASSGFDGGMLAISDRATLSVQIVASRVNNTSLELQKLLYQGGAWQRASKSLLIIPGSFGAASLQLSPDGKQLAVYHYTTAEGDFGLHKAQLLTYNVGDNLSFASEVQPILSYSSSGTLQASSSCMAEFTAKGDLVYTSSTPEHKLGAWFMDGTTPTNLVESGCAGLRLLSDGKLLLGQSKSKDIGLFNPETITVVPLALVGDAAVGAYTGYLTNNHWYINAEGRPDRTDTYMAGLRSYELKDHLGNVRVVISDELNTNGTATASAAYQYYAFGSPMPGRYGLANLVGQGGYRYGFNGKEKDDDLTKTTGTTYDYGFRIYDARIAKFLSVDPLTKDYPGWSPYPFAMNRSIDGIDLDGLEMLDYRANYVMKVGKLQMGDGSYVTVYSLIRESTGHIHSTYNLENQFTELSSVPSYSLPNMEGSDDETPKSPEYKSGGSIAAKHKNKVINPIEVRNNKTGAAVDALSIVFESGYNAMKESSSAKADDEMQAIDAFKKAYCVVTASRSKIRSAFNLINWNGEFAEKMKSDNAFKEQIFNGIMADVMNYIVGSRDDKRDFSNYPLGFPSVSNFSQYKLFVYRMGEQLSKSKGLNIKQESNTGFINVLWRTIKSMQPNSD